MIFSLAMVPLFLALYAPAISHIDMFYRLKQSSGAGCSHEESAAQNSG